jgi:hypothetical protein
MANLQPLSKPAGDGDEHRDSEKRQEFRELRGRIKELRETIQILASRRKSLETRQTELAAELGASHTSK